MNRLTSILLVVLIGGCATSDLHTQQDEYGVTVDYLGRKWPWSYQHYGEVPDQIPEFVVSAEMKRIYIDAGAPNDEVQIASSFSPVLSVRAEPVLLPKKFRSILENAVEKNRPYKMNDIGWPVAPPSHAYVLISIEPFVLISLTRYDNAFVIQNAFFASAPIDDGSVPYEFQALGAWSTWVESSTLAKFLDVAFEEDFPQQTPFTKWLSNAKYPDNVKDEESKP